MSQKVTPFMGGLGRDVTSKFEIQSNASVTVGDGTTTGNVVIGGEVGIGTSSPSAKLHINHSGFSAGSTSSVSALKTQGAFGGGITISDTAEAGFYADGAGTNFRMYVGKTASDTPLSKVVMTATSSGNVGIGTNTPSSKLDVSGDIEGDGLIIDGTFDLGTL